MTTAILENKSGVPVENMAMMVMYLKSLVLSQMQADTTFGKTLNQRTKRATTGYFQTESGKVVKVNRRALKRASKVDGRLDWWI